MGERDIADLELGLEAAGESTIWPLQCQIWQLQQPSEICRFLRSVHDEQITSAAQLALIACLRKATTLRYPPGQNYSSRLLKTVMSAVEKDCEHVEDELADLYLQTVSAKQPQRTDGSLQLADGWCYKTFAYNASTGSKLRPKQDEQARQNSLSSAEVTGSEGEAINAPQSSQQYGLITLKLSLNLFEGATGCHEWEAGFLLAEFVLSHPDVFKGKRCLELGCGAGVVGVALCRTHAASVQLTDGNDATVDNCKHNLETNQCIPQKDCQTNQLAGNQNQDVQVLQMQWEHPGDLHPDVILAADVLYDPAAIAPMISTLRLLLRTNSLASCKQEPAAYIATTLRNEATLQQFLHNAAASQFTVADVSKQARQGSVRFQHHLKLDSQRSNIFLHKISYSHVVLD